MGKDRRKGLTLPERPSEGLRIKNYIAAHLLRGEHPRLYRARVDDRPHAAGPRLDVALVVHLAETRFRGAVSEGGGRWVPTLDLKQSDLGVEWFDTAAGAFDGLQRRLRREATEARRAWEAAERRLALAEEGGDRFDVAPPPATAPPRATQLELPGTGRRTCPGCWTSYDETARRCPTCALR